MGGRSLFRDSGADVGTNRRETFGFHSGPGEKADLVADLVGVARGVQLILWHTSEHLPSDRSDFNSIATGLSMALRLVVDPTDAYFFVASGN